MLFPEEDSPLLKAWIVKRLENTSDADADVLADYVLALLHTDDGTEDVKSKCMSEMGNFLTEDPSSFVNDLFEIIQYKSYIPGAAPPPKPAPTAPAPATLLPGLGDPSTSQPFIPTGPSGGSARKRGFQDRGDFDAPTGRDQFPGGRQYKQLRRGGGYGGRKGYVDPDRPQPLPQEQQYPFQNTPGQHALSFGQPGQVPQIPPFDPSNPMEAMRQLQRIGQQMGLPITPFADFSQQQPGFQQNAPAQQGRKGRCWDFDRKGFCPRGLKCKFDHSIGTESVPYNLPTPQLSGHIPLPGEGPFPSQFPSQPININTQDLGSSHYPFAAPFDFSPFFDFFNNESTLTSLTQEAEYDPNSATLSQPPQMPQFPQQHSPFQGNAHPNQNRNNRQGQQRRKAGSGRAPFSAEGPVNDRSQTKVVVESIPEENFEEDQVRNFFAQFGNVEEVTMMGYKRLAIVKFDNWASANAAYKSPKVIFDNRFVKVYWYKDEKHSEIVNGGANGFKNGRPANGVKREDQSADVKMEEGEEGEEIDMEEFTRKQEEAQRLHEEKMAKIREIERQREELEKRQKELQVKQAAERQRLMEKLASSSRKNSTDQGGGGEAAAEAAATTPDGGTGGEASKTEALKATLAKLRGEAEALGIDPNAQQQQLQDDSFVQFSTPYVPGYGRGGRVGGGYYRGGRGGYVPRGSFRGRGGGGGRGNFHAAYAAFSLDNRPKTVAISGIDFSAPEKDEALRRHLFSFGEGVTEIQTTPTVTHLSFSDRKQAETFYNGFKSGKIQGINDGDTSNNNPAVEVSWVSGPAAALPGSTTTSVNTTTTTTGGGGGGLDSAMEDDATGHHHHDNGGEDGKDGTQQAESLKQQLLHNHQELQSQSQQQQQQHEPGEARDVDYDVAGENEWDE